MTIPLHRSAGYVANYDKHPFVPAGTRAECARGWDEICAVLRGSGARIVVVESFPGVNIADLGRLVESLQPDLAVDAGEALKSKTEIETMLRPELTDDPVFGRLTGHRMRDFFDVDAQLALRRRIDACSGRVVLTGPGASLLTVGDLLVLAEMPRWETQLRQRRGEVANLGADNRGEQPSLQYKRSFFVDWRVCDQLKNEIWGRLDFVLDTTDSRMPKLVAKEVVARALERAARRPFRVVPYFDPAPWGGQWMKRICNLEREAPNFGWCFDCVPEENSLLLGFDDVRFETPASNLVFQQPSALLGEAVSQRFGGEFPIRFDFLDTMDGGNLSLQVHPLTEYIQQHFGMRYTQDESYYLLDAGEGGTVFLGLRDGIDREQMAEDLRAASRGESIFDATRYVNHFPATRHDHFLIPAGTIHCSGANSMVLEISATPYIFTFKLWDWDRPGLDGRPRPTHVDHGLRNIQWERDTDYARRRLINQVERVAEGEGWVEERTGLHPAEFIETRRHWFEGQVTHARSGGVEVLNLVQGNEAMVESPDRAFDPFTVHYAETFIVPAAAGPYIIRPSGAPADDPHGTIKASVRRDASG